VARWIGIALLALGGLAVALAWGWRSLVVYLFLAGIAGALALAARVGGDWVRDSSRGRFERDEERRR
jgi:hypothetical protein